MNWTSRLKTYIGVNEKIARTKSGQDLIERLNKHDDSLICSLVHKFGKRGGETSEADYDKHIEEIQNRFQRILKQKVIYLYL